MDGFQYTDAKLSFFPHAEGYVNATYNATVDTAVPQDPQFNHVYQYNDHLGNIRLNYGYDQKHQVLKIIEENHYYPFGLKHTNYNSGKKKYDFVGEEFAAVLTPNEDIKTTIKQVVPQDGFVGNNYKHNSKELQES